MRHLYHKTWCKNNSLWLTSLMCWVLSAFSSQSELRKSAFPRIQPQMNAIVLIILISFQPLQTVYKFAVHQDKLNNINTCIADGNRKDKLLCTVSKKPHTHLIQQPSKDPSSRNPVVWSWCGVKRPMEVSRCHCRAHVSISETAHKVRGKTAEDARKLQKR